MIEMTWLGRQDYEQVWTQMRAFVEKRPIDAPEALWIVEHPAVFTLGQAGKAMHVKSPGDISVVHSDRGGQVTYHGEGQIVVYTLLNLARHGLSARGLVTLLEQSVIDVLSLYGVEGQVRADAPGVYVNGAKIAAIGLRVRQGWSYHGVSLNVAMDLSPYDRINPCGFEGMPVTQMRDLYAGKLSLAQIGEQLIDCIKIKLTDDTK